MNVTSQTNTDGNANDGNANNRVPITSFGGGSNRSSAPSSSSSSTTNDTGRYELDSRLSSVLSHPFCIALLWKFHDKSLHDDSDHFPFHNIKLFHSREHGNNNDHMDQWNKVLSSAWEKKAEGSETWNKTNQSNVKETSLTSHIVSHINEFKKRNFEAHCETYVSNKGIEGNNIQEGSGRMDIILTDEKEIPVNGCTPLMVIEIGLNGKNWWGKLGQCAKYVNLMVADKTIHFDRPLLMSVITIDTNESEASVQIGVFFCRRRCANNSSNHSNFRMTLLWHTACKAIDDASKHFGKILQITGEFNEWLKHGIGLFSGNDDILKYEYFSSNCCRIGERVREGNMPLQCIQPIIIIILFCYVAHTCCCWYILVAIQYRYFVVMTIDSELPLEHQLFIQMLQKK